MENNPRKMSEIMSEYLAKIHDKNMKLSEKNLRNNARISPEKYGENTAKNLGIPQEMIVNRPEKSDNYDANTLGCYCKEFEYNFNDAVYLDREEKNFWIASGKYNDEMTYINNCPWCGTEIGQDKDNLPDHLPDESIPEPKENT